jgi:hypothetical protein
MAAGRKGFRQTISSKEEAIRSQLPFQSTTLLLETEDSTKDVFIKQKIVLLLKAIVQLACTRGSDTVNDHSRKRS